MIKIGSSKWIKTKGGIYNDFYWQSGYGAFGISPKEIDDVDNYIRNQKDHHQSTSFQDEYRKLLDEFGIEYDEQYVWD